MVNQNKIQIQLFVFEYFIQVSQITGILTTYRTTAGARDRPEFPLILLVYPTIIYVFIYTEKLV